MQQESHFWRAIPVLLLAVALQTTWLARFEPLGVHLDLPFLVALSVALLGGVQRGAWAGFFAGLLMSVYAPWHPGSMVVSHAVSGGVMGLFQRRFSADNPLAAPLCALAGTLLAELVFMVMSPADFPLLWWVRHAVLTAFLHAMAIWPLHWLMSRLIAPPSRMMFA